MLLIKFQRSLYDLAESLSVFHKLQMSTSTSMPFVKWRRSNYDWQNHLLDFFVATNKTKNLFGKNGSFTTSNTMLAVLRIF